ncbi:MAG: autotransporter outer membrane beta-barrel domain-containing protein [Puniceicoccales bacterium]|jgi:hypothetical protein|nr:autotransporter outer membrane beta-barrel domain-containing protein [Puniceicoccales bacterium]
MPDSVTKDIVEKVYQYLFPAVSPGAEVPDTYEVTFNEDTIVFFEKLLNDEFCPYRTKVNRELATLSVAANTLVSDAVSRRITNVKGCLADPFVLALYGHSRRSENHGLGYSNDMGGFIVGIDKVWAFANERYLRLGVALGYIHGKTKFFGPLADPITSTKHNIYALELFAAYELFNDKLLKTNIGVTLGYNHSSDKLHGERLHGRIPSSLIANEKLRSNNIFLGLEFVKNLCSYNGFQFGLWFRANYGHVAQKGYKEPTTVEHISPVHHNILATVIGINVEREVFKPEYADKKLILSLKAGWECHPMHKHSSITALMNGDTYEVITPQQPSKNSAIVSFAAAKKFNVHWGVAGSYVARLNGGASSHNFSAGIECEF